MIMVPSGFFVFFGIVAVVSWFFTRAMYRRRIEEHIEMQRGTLLAIRRSWTIRRSNAGRVYLVRYRDTQGNIHEAEMGVSIFTKVWIRSSRMVEQIAPNVDGDEEEIDATTGSPEAINMPRKGRGHWTLRTIMVLLLVLGGFGFLSGFPPVGGRIWKDRDDEAPLGQLEGVAVDSEGNIYCGVQFYGRVHKYDPAGRFLFSVSSQTYGAFQIHVNRADELEVASSRGKGVSRYSPDGEFLEWESHVPEKYREFAVKGETECVGPGGDIYRIRGGSIVRTPRIGKARTIVSMPWYKWFITGPFPAWSFWAAGILLGIGMKCYEGLTRTSAQDQGPTASSESAFRFVASLDRDTPIPPDVTELQADGADCMDVGVYCRFAAPDDVIDAIIASGYESTEWDQIKSEMIPSISLDGFSPRWAPRKVGEKECYIRRVEDRGSPRATYLVVDRWRGVVHAAGGSAVR